MSECLNKVLSVYLDDVVTEIGIRLADLKKAVAHYNHARGSSLSIPDAKVPPPGSSEACIQCYVSARSQELALYLICLQITPTGGDPSACFDAVREHYCEYLIPNCPCGAK